MERRGRLGKGNETRKNKWRERRSKGAKEQGEFRSRKMKKVSNQKSKKSKLAEE